MVLEALELGLNPYKTIVGIPLFAQTFTLCRADCNTFVGTAENNYSIPFGVWCSLEPLESGINDEVCGPGDAANISLREGVLFYSEVTIGALFTDELQSSNA